MITGTLNSETSIVASPPISFPFLWQGPNSGRVFLRFATYDPPHGIPCHGSHERRGDVDICLVGMHEHDRAYKLGAPDVVGLSDKEAWSMRLPPTDKVVLQNTFTS